MAAVPAGQFRSKPKRVLEYGVRLRFSTEIYGSKREKTVFHENLQEACLVLAEISGNLREFTGECYLGILYSSFLLKPPTNCPCRAGGGGTFASNEQSAPRPFLRSRIQLLLLLLVVVVVVLLSWICCYYFCYYYYYYHYYYYCWYASIAIITIVSEGGMIRLESLVELKFLNSSFSSLSSYWNYRQAAPRRAIRADSITIDSIPPSSALQSVFIISNRKTSNWASQILKTNMLFICPYCLNFQIARV